MRRRRRRRRAYVRAREPYTADDDDHEKNSPLSHSSHLGHLLTPMRGHRCNRQLPAIEETRRSSAIMPNRDHCCVPQCQNNRDKNIPNLTFHQFSSDESIRKQWVVKIRRDVGKSFQLSWLGYRCHCCAHVFTLIIKIWSIYR